MAFKTSDITLSTYKIYREFLHLCYIGHLLLVHSLCLVFVIAPAGQLLVFSFLSLTIVILACLGPGLRGCLMSVS